VANTEEELAAIYHEKIAAADSEKHAESTE
jgi:hypothetical protein